MCLMCTVIFSVLCVFIRLTLMLWFDIAQADSVEIYQIFLLESHF